MEIRHEVFQVLLSVCCFRYGSFQSPQSSDPQFTGFARPPIVTSTPCDYGADNPVYQSPDHDPRKYMHCGPSGTYWIQQCSSGSWFKPDVARCVPSSRYPLPAAAARMILKSQNTQLVGAPVTIPPQTEVHTSQFQNFEAAPEQSTTGFASSSNQGNSQIIQAGTFGTATKQNPLVQQPPEAPKFPARVAENQNPYPTKSLVPVVAANQEPFPPVLAPINPLVDSKRIPVLLNGRPGFWVPMPGTQDEVDKFSPETTNTPKPVFKPHLTPEASGIGEFPQETTNWALQASNSQSPSANPWPADASGFRGRNTDTRSTSTFTNPSDFTSNFPAGAETRSLFPPSSAAGNANVQPSWQASHRSNIHPQSVLRGTPETRSQFQPTQQSRLQTPSDHSTDFQPHFQPPTSAANFQDQATLQSHHENSLPTNNFQADGSEAVTKRQPDLSAVRSSQTAYEAKLEALAAQFGGEFANAGRIPHIITDAEGAPLRAIWLPKETEGVSNGDGVFTTTSEELNNQAMKRGTSVKQQAFSSDKGGTGLIQPDSAEPIPWYGHQHEQSNFWPEHAVPQQESQVDSNQVGWATRNQPLPEQFENEEEIPGVRPTKNPETGQQPALPTKSLLPIMLENSCMSTDPSCSYSLYSIRLCPDVHNASRFYSCGPHGWIQQVCPSGHRFSGEGCDVEVSPFNVGTGETADQSFNMIHHNRGTHAPPAPDGKSDQERQFLQERGQHQHDLQQRQNHHHEMGHMKIAPGETGIPRTESNELIPVNASQFAGDTRTAPENLLQPPDFNELDVPRGGGGNVHQTREEFNMLHPSPAPISILQIGSTNFWGSPRSPVPMIRHPTVEELLANNVNPNPAQIQPDFDLTRNQNNKFNVAGTIKPHATGRGNQGLLDSNRINVEHVPAQPMDGKVLNHAGSRIKTVGENLSRLGQDILTRTEQQRINTGLNYEEYEPNYDDEEMQYSVLLRPSSSDDQRTNQVKDTSIHRVVHEQIATTTSPSNLITPIPWTDHLKLSHLLKKTKTKTSVATPKPGSKPPKAQKSSNYDYDYYYNYDDSRNEVPDTDTPQTNRPSSKGLFQTHESPEIYDPRDRSHLDKAPVITPWKSGAVKLSGNRFVNAHEALGQKLAKYTGARATERGSQRGTSGPSNMSNRKLRQNEAARDWRFAQTEEQQYDGQRQLNNFQYTRTSDLAAGPSEKRSDRLQNLETMPVLQTSYSIDGISRSRSVNGMVEGVDYEPVSLKRRSEEESQERNRQDRKLHNENEHSGQQHTFNKITTTTTQPPTEPNQTRSPRTTTSPKEHNQQAKIQDESEQLKHLKKNESVIIQGNKQLWAPIPGAECLLQPDAVQMWLDHTDKQRFYQCIFKINTHSSNNTDVSADGGKGSSQNGEWALYICPEGASYNSLRRKCEYDFQVNAQQSLDGASSNGM